MSATNTEEEEEDRAARYNWNGDDAEAFEITEGDGEVLSLEGEASEVEDGFLGDLVERAKAGFRMGKRLAGADENVDIERRIELSNGLVIYIENEEGSIRKGPWGEVVMRHPYGYIAGTAGTDGDCVDVFLGPGYETVTDVYVVHQGGDDPEDKLMIGFASARVAMQAYLANYTKPAPDDWSMERIQMYELPQKLAKFNGRRIVRDESRN